MTKIISLDDFKKKKEQPENLLTKSGQDFRDRFSKSIKKLEEQFCKELEKAKFSSGVKTRINISTVLKHAKASPLAAYSELHKNFVNINIQEAIDRCNQKLEGKFKVKKRPTIEDLQIQLSEERELFKLELSKLASQKMTEYLELNDNKK